MPSRGEIRYFRADAGAYKRKTGEVSRYVRYEIHLPTEIGERLSWPAPSVLVGKIKDGKLILEPKVENDGT